MLSKLKSLGKSKGSGGDKGAGDKDPKGKDPKAGLRGKGFEEQQQALSPDGPGNAPEKKKGSGGGSAHRVKERAKNVGKNAIDNVKAGAKSIGETVKSGVETVGNAMGQAATAVGELIKPKEAPAQEQAPDQDPFAEAKARHARVLAEYGPEVSKWLDERSKEFKKGAKPNDPKEVDHATDIINFLYMTQNEHENARTEEEFKAEHEREANASAKSKAPSLTRERFADDPMHYDIPNLPKAEIDALKKIGLTEDEILAITLYCGQAAYPMNRVMRGELRDEAAVKAYLPWALKLDSALAKIPQTVQNLQMGGNNDTAHPKIDPKLAPNAEIPLKDVPLYRTDGWSPFFVKEVLANWRVGARVNNATFLSTTTLRGSYNLAQGVSRIIKVKSSRGAASIMNLSTTKKENEVLFRPNTSMKITKITQLPNTTPKEGPQAGFSKDNGKSWEMFQEPQKEGPKYNTDLSRAGPLANPYEIDERKDSGVRDVHDMSKSYTATTLPQNMFEVETTIDDGPSETETDKGKSAPASGGHSGGEAAGGGQLAQKGQDPKELVKQAQGVAVAEVLKKFPIPFKP